MLAKFRGTLYGVLVGDCFGNLFQENSILSKGSRLVLRNFLDNLEKQTKTAGKQNLFCYSFNWFIYYKIMMTIQK